MALLNSLGGIPPQEKRFTAQAGELKAELTRNQPIFSDSPEKYIGD